MLHLALILSQTVSPTVDLAALNEKALAAWTGQRVRILPTKAAACPVVPDDGPSVYREKPGGKTLQVNRFAGRGGSVVRARRITAWETEIVLQFDDGKRLYASSDFGIAFDAELEAAKKLVGQQWWSRGTQLIGNPETICSQFGGDRRIEIKNLEPVTITAAEFGTHLQKIHLRVKTADGREAILDGWDGYDYVDPAFHVLNEERGGVRMGPYADRFHVENPREKYKAWSPAVWALVEKGEVAIGMTEEAAGAACGRAMRAIGFVLSGDTTGAVMDCNGKRFLIEGGKVTKFVDR